MRKSLTALTAATTIAVAAVAAPTTADARWGWWAPGLGLFAAGALLGSALARPYYAYPYYGYGYGYGPYYGYGYPAYYGYYAPRPYYGYYGRRYYARRYYHGGVINGCCRWTPPPGHARCVVCNPLKVRVRAG